MTKFDLTEQNSSNNTTLTIHTFDSNTSMVEANSLLLECFDQQGNFVSITVGRKELIDILNDTRVGCFTSDCGGLRKFIQADVV